MIYSKERDFLFIKGRKVASTSVEIALSMLCGPEDIITPITPIDERERLKLGGRGSQNYSADRDGERQYLVDVMDEDENVVAKAKPPSGPYRNHMSLLNVIEAYGGLPTERVMCIVRRPYEKVLSWANHKASFSQYRKGATMQGPQGQLKRKIDRGLRSGDALKVRNIDLYQDQSGRMIATPVKYEMLDEAFADYLRSIGVEEPPALPHAKKGAMASTKDVRDFLAPEHIEQINELFSEEFEAFGYEKLQPA